MAMVYLEEPHEGVLSEILSGLPLQSLFRFKCVSKSWNALITSLHRHHQCVLLKRYTINDKTKKTETTTFSFFNASSNLESVDDFSRLGPEFEKSIIHGHSHGIVCLSFPPFNDIFLFNTATGELRKLPPSILFDCKHFDPYDEFAVLMTVGFGYDPKSRDFKVVRVVALRGGEPQYYFATWSAEIYDLSKDRWREIKTPIPKCSVGLQKVRSFDMYYEGFFYWRAFSDEEGQIIMWFDMSKEIFGQILVPMASEIQDDSWGTCLAPESSDFPMRKTLGFLNGSMVLLYYPSTYVRDRDDSISLDVWGLVKGEENKGKWSKLFRIGPLFGVNIPLAFVSSNELLLEGHDGHLVLYNFCTQTSKHITVKGRLSWFDCSL